MPTDASMRRFSIAAADFSKPSAGMRFHSAGETYSNLSPLISLRIPKSIQTGVPWLIMIFP